MTIQPKANNICGECRSSAVTWTFVNVEVPYQDRSGNQKTTTARIPKGFCGDCGASVYPYEALVLRHEAACHGLGALSPKELIEGRKRLGMTQEQFARHSGFGVASIRRWERGARIQTLSSDRHLRTLLQGEGRFTALAVGEPPMFDFRPRSDQSRLAMGMRDQRGVNLGGESPKLPSFQDAQQHKERS